LCRIYDAGAQMHCLQRLMAKRLKAGLETVGIFQFRPFLENTQAYAVISGGMEYGRRSASPSNAMQTWRRSVSLIRASEISDPADGGPTGAK